MAKKRENKNVDVYLDDTTSNAGSVVKRSVETEHLSRPVHHHCLELRAGWAGGPLPVIASGTEGSSQDEGEGKLQCEHERAREDRTHIESRVGSDTSCVQVPEDGCKGAGGGKVGKEAWVLPVHQTFIFIFIFPEGVSQCSSLDGEPR
jgi:hypothetical protein